MFLFRKIASPFFLSLCLCLLAACGEVDKTEAGNQKKPKPSNTGKAEDAFSQKLEAFTGGHTKAVWARYLGSGSDVFANFDKLQLWGIDSRDGLGVRPILEKQSNYARPMIMPDGSGIVFTNKNADRGDSGEKRFHPVVWRVDWNGENLTELGKGMGVDVWRDPETQRDWVYVTDLEPTKRSSISGRKLERFPVDDPGTRELIWDKTRVSTDNVQVSGDGKRASCLFPWPHAGVLNLEKSTSKKYQHGCWPSMAPDASHHAWVFDGSHKNVFMFTDGAAKQWVVPINTAPGVGNHEVYHPRWSNHVRYLAMTGPYRGETVTRSDAGEVEVYLGKFSPDLKKVEEWFQLTDDDAGDVFPDLWIAGGEKASVAADDETAAPTADGADSEKTVWPAGEGPYLFVWENREADNLAGERECSVEAKDKARFGPHGEMLTDGGYFEMDDASAGAIKADLSTVFTLQLVITPNSEKQQGTIFSSGNLEIGQNNQQWTYSVGKLSGSLGAVTAQQPSHLAIVSDGKSVSVYINGSTGAATDHATIPPAEITLGRNWKGSIEGIAIGAFAESPNSIAADSAHWKKLISARKPIPTIRLRGKLIEMTGDRPVEALDTYNRGLLGYLYEVEEVLEGDFDGDNIVVMHWTILDRKPLPGFPREIGKTYELLLQPYSDHPELISERQWNDLLDPSEPWFDISSP
ncbi:MAG: hypothetical protein KDN19_04720 [Verrucomicrobiae bacterium]|nr:hypothetical protein [Verrucomicrobiae bacterium]